MASMVNKALPEHPAIRARTPLPMRLTALTVLELEVEGSKVERETRACRVNVGETEGYCE